MLRTRTDIPSRLSRLRIRYSERVFVSHAFYSLNRQRWEACTALGLLQSFGKRNAMYSPENVPPLTARTMYCLPLSIYVIGEPLCGAGRYTAPTSLPVALS